MNSYKDLTVYQKAIQLCVNVYKASDRFPKSEMYGLTNQIRRNAVSIPSNIAEGQKRGHLAEYIQFLQISNGSGAELETQLLIALKIGYLTDEEYRELTNLLNEIMKMLNRLISVLKKSKNNAYER